jgi:hypothetical protein
MDYRQIVPEDCMVILSRLQDATHEQMGSMMVHTGRHPEYGQIIIVVSDGDEPLLFHGLSVDSH